MGDEVQLTASRFFYVGNSKRIYLTVTIGNMNVGGTSVWWNGDFVKEGPITDLPIENPEGDLYGNLLKCITKVKDINPSTNNTIVTYELSGEEDSKEFPFEIEVKQEGGYAIYSITFILL